MRQNLSLAAVFLVFLALPPVFATQSPQMVTWSRDIAPIVYQHCSGCHRPGQTAPFPLLSYEDARQKADLIARVTAVHYMPPWKPVHGYGVFSGENRLTAAQIALIGRWARNRAPAGDLDLAPSTPVFSSGWQLGPPDAAITLPQPYSVPADGPDQYRCFVLSPAADRDRYVRAWEFSPGGTRVLHHALIFVDSRRASNLPDNYECFGTPGFFPSGALGGWSPGAHAAIMPPGTATHVPKGARLVMQLHFHPTGKVELANPTVALYYAAQPPTRVLMDVALGSNRIDIPAGATDYKIHDHFNLPVPLEVIGIIPHAHYICKDMKGWAILPNGKKQWLLWIDDWDFNWQSQYRYAVPLHLPAGTEVRMEFTYDNSAANIHNPNHPPRRVQWGAASSDEMAGLHLQVIPRNETDMHELGMALWGKVMRGVGGSFYRQTSSTN